MKLFQSLRTKKIFYRILVLLLAMACSMFVLVFFFVHTHMSRSYQERRLENCQQLLTTASEYVRLALEDLGRAMQQLLWNTDITRAVLTPELVTYDRKVEIVKTLGSFETDNPLVDQAFLLTYADGRCFDSAGNIVEMKESLIRGYLPEYGQICASSLANGDFPAQVISQGEKLALLQPFPTPETNGALLVTLRRESLFQFLAESTTEDGDYMEIQAQDGAVLFAGGPSAARSGEPLVYAADTGWNFCLWQNPLHIELGREEFLAALGPWALFLGLISLGAALFITWSIYRPIGKLHSLVGQAENGEETVKGNELEQISQVYQSTLRQKADLSQEIAGMAPIVRERVYKNLLKGKTISQEALPERLQSLGSPFGISDYYVVMVAALSGDYTGDVVEATERLHRLFGGCAREEEPVCESLVTDDDFLILILCYREEADSRRRTGKEAAICRNLEECARQAGVEEWLSVGRGRLYQGILSLADSFRDARQDLDYRQYHLDEGRPESSVLQGEEASREILDLAMDGELEKAEGALNSFLSRLHLEDMGGEEKKRCCDELVNRLAEQLLNLHASEEKMELFDAYYRAGDAPEDWEGPAREVGQQALSALCHYSQKSRNRYVKQAKEYIQGHSGDSRLSLETVAESVGIHSAYLSRLFYEICQVNFVSYVNRCRVEKAEILLKQTKIPVKEVGFKTGFNSMQNFNRVFKKYTGMTPGAYRKQEQP